MKFKLNEEMHANKILGHLFYSALITILAQFFNANKKFII